MITNLKVYFSKNSFLAGSLLITIVFLITRIPYYIYYPVFNVSSDSASYLAAAFDIINFRQVLFDIRTPGYPLFIAFIWIFSKSFIAIAFAQSVLALISGIYLLKVIDKYFRSVTFVSAVSIAAFISSSYFVLLESGILTESLFISSLLFTCAFLISAIKSGKLSGWILFSSFTAITIIIRPAGLFLAAVIIFLIIYLIVNKYKAVYFGALIFPVSILILLLCTYNYMTLKKFTITPFGEANLSGVTILFMEPSDNYSSKVNEAIRSTLDSIPSRDINYVKNSNGITKLYNIFKDNFFRQMNLTGSLLSDNSGTKYSDVQHILREISIDAIKKNPKIYLKFFVSNFIYFFNNTRATMNYADELLKSYDRAVVQKKYITDLESGKWKQISSDKSDNGEVRNYYLNAVNESADSDGFVQIDNNLKMKDTFAMNIYNYYEQTYNFIFRNFIWLIIFLITFILSVYRTLKNRFRDNDAFIIFLFGIMFISKALLVSSVESSLVRYSYTVEFVIFLSLPFLILLLKSNKHIIPLTNKKKNN